MGSGVQRTVITLLIYRTGRGVQPFVEWISTLRNERAAAVVKARLARIRLGNLGNIRSVGEGVHEFKIDYGAGYRVYFGWINRSTIVLLLGGDKGTQDENIKSAKKYLHSLKKTK